MKKLFAILVLSLSLLASNINIDVEQRGCCSHHGGVSGCVSGRVTCNDGTYSPTCTCKGGSGIEACNKADKNSTKS